MSKEKKPPRKLTEQRLKNAAWHYLGRYESTEKRLRETLERKVRRHEQRGGEVPAEISGWITELVTEAQRLGYIDDARFAERQIELGLQRGDSLKKIGAKLYQKGIAPETIDSLLSAVRAEDADADFHAALRFATKKKLGPFALDPTTRTETYKKDMAKMARAGFDFEMARKILDAETPEDLDSFLL